MLGRAWVGLLSAHDIAFDALGRDGLDLEDMDAVRGLDCSAYSHVISCAAWTAVDDAESAYARAHTVNGLAVGELAKRCVAGGARLVTYSTDYVFDGKASEPYAVGGAHDPVNAYGRSKAAGEVLLAEAGGEWLCVRTSWVYAPWGKNFVRTIAGAARARPELKVVDDQRGRPTSAEGLARSSLGLMMAGARGFAHATDGGECSWYEFAEEIVRLLSQEHGLSSPRLATVQPCDSTEYPRPAVRPAYSVLDLSATEAVVGPMVPWECALADVMRRLELV